MKPDMKPCRARKLAEKNRNSAPSALSFHVAPRQGRGDWSLEPGNQFNSPANPETKARIGLSFKNPYGRGNFGRCFNSK